MQQIDQNELEKTVLQIRNIIQKEYPTLQIYEYKPDNEDEIIFSINDEEIYYSDRYQSIIMRINIEILLPRKLFNFIFVLEDFNDFIPRILFQQSRDNNIQNNWQLSLENEFLYYHEVSDEQKACLAA